MADAAEGGGKKKKGALMPLIIGLAAAIVAGGAGFALVSMDILPTPEKKPVEEAHVPDPEPVALPHTAFVSLTPLIVTLGAGDTLRQLQLSAQLEVAPEAVDAVSLLTPRVVDVLNTYLRAVESDVVENPEAMLRMRAQMLRRIQVVTGGGMVRDVLVSEFILR